MGVLADFLEEVVLELSSCPGEDPEFFQREVWGYE